MKKIYNYITFKIQSTKFTILFSVLVVYEFSLLLSIIGDSRSYNIYDFIMKNYNYLSLFNFIYLFFIILIYNIFEKKNFYNYLSIKFNSRKEMYISNVITTLVFSIIFIVLIDIIVMLMGSFMDFHNIWSDYFFKANSVQINTYFTDKSIELVTEKLTPVSFVFITNILVILYLVFTSILFIVLNIIFKRSEISFIFIIILNVLNRGIDDSRLFFTDNIYILSAKVNEITNGTYILSRISYWLILISVIYFIGIIIVKNKDCNYGDSL